MNVSFALDDHNQHSFLVNHQDVGNNNNTSSINGPFLSSSSTPTAAAQTAATTPTVPSKRKRSGTATVTPRGSQNQNSNINGFNALASPLPSSSQNSNSSSKTVFLPQEFPAGGRSPAVTATTPTRPFSASTNVNTSITSSTTSTSSGSDSIECICGFSYDDGFSIACDVCGRWSHARCYDISQSTVPDLWQCVDCKPRPVDREKAIREQKVRKKVVEAEKQAALMADQAAAAANGGGIGVGGGGGVNGTNGAVGQQGAGATGTGPPAKRGRRRGGSVGAPGLASSHSGGAMPSLGQPSSSQPAGSSGANVNAEDEHVDIEEEWRASFVPLAADHIPQKSTRDRLRAHAQSWRGVVALGPSTSSSSSSPDSLDDNVYEKPKTKVSTIPPGAANEDEDDVASRVRPPSYALHTTAPIPGEQFVAPFTSTVIPSSSYLSDPLNEYAHIGMPMPFVHLIPPPLNLALDARLTGSEARFARSGCKPNAVLRPFLCRGGNKTKGKEKQGAAMATTDHQQQQQERRMQTPEAEYDPTMPPPRFPASVTNGVNGITSNGKLPSPHSSTSPMSQRSTSTSSDDPPNHNDDADAEDRVSFAIFALRDLKASEEVVLGWEWDDGSVVHELPALVEALGGGLGRGQGQAAAGPSKMTPHHLERLRLQMQNIVHSLQSSFVACACGKNAKDCAVRWMERFVDGGAESVRGGPEASSDLGPLIGQKRGVRTRVRGGLATGGMNGVVLINEDGEEIPSDEHPSASSSKQRLSGPGMSGRVPPRLAARKSVEEAEMDDIVDDMAPPPKMRRGRGGGTAGRANGRIDGGGGAVAAMRVDMDVGVVGTAGSSREKSRELERTSDAFGASSSRNSPAPLVMAPPPPPPAPVMPTGRRTSSSIFSLLNADPVSPISSSHPRPALFTPPEFAPRPPSPPPPAPTITPEITRLLSPARLIERSTPLPPEPRSPSPPSRIPSPTPSPHQPAALSPPTHQHQHQHPKSRSPSPEMMEEVQVQQTTDEVENHTTPESTTPARRSVLHSPMSDVQDDGDGGDDHGRRSRRSPSQPTNALHLSTSLDDAMDVDDGAITIHSPQPQPQPVITTNVVVEDFPSPDFDRVDELFPEAHESRSPTPTPALSTRSPSPTSTALLVQEEEGVVKAVEESPASPSIRSTDSQDLVIDVEVVEERHDEDAVEEAHVVEKEKESTPVQVNGILPVEEAKVETEHSASEGSPVIERDLPITVEEEPPAEPAPAEDIHDPPEADEPHEEEKAQEPDAQANADPPTAPEAPKVKLSMADYRKRKQKQREEASAKTGTAPTTPSVEASAELHNGAPLGQESSSETSETAKGLVVPSEGGDPTPASPSVSHSTVDVGATVASVDVEVEVGKEVEVVDKHEVPADEKVVAETAQPEAEASRSSPVEVKNDSAVTSELLARFYSKSPSEWTKPAESTKPNESTAHEVAEPSDRVRDGNGSAWVDSGWRTDGGSPIWKSFSSDWNDRPLRPPPSPNWSGPYGVGLPPTSPGASPVYTGYVRSLSCPSPDWGMTPTSPKSPKSPAPTPPHQVARSTQEDGEILSNPSTPAPRSPVTTRPLPRKSISNVPSSAPPTQPRSFRNSPPPSLPSARTSHSPRPHLSTHTRSHTPSSYRPRSPLPVKSTRYIPPDRDLRVDSRADPRAIPANPPPRVPSGPRALRDPHPSSRSIPGGPGDRDRDRRPPSGPSSYSRIIPPDRDRDRDRDRDWERGRGWGPPSSRARGRGGRF
ncbi:hypothetical protein SCHPADRAFT_910550 [Schizopora paradoxa]|uniref:PHD-type domain-containing protein n=1 Tax=Schizopora paradoxa TaxID=27342 RepID=A0A0H2R2S9_9AGAM|nr:hypothetical protein SCHPADRAFT_910550 [Schizopora paradoxa]